MPRLQHACPDTFITIRTSLHYCSQLDVLIWHVLDMFRTFYGITSSCNNVRTRPQLSAVLRHERGEITQNEIGTIICSMFHRCTGCVGLTEIIPLIKHSVTFKNDPYPVL